MKERLIAIYARVATEHEAQISALENQVQYSNIILNGDYTKDTLMKELQEHLLIKDGVSLK